MNLLAYDFFYTVQLSSDAPVVNKHQYFKEL